MISLVVVAGGSGSRYGAKNKLLELLADKPVFVHSLLRLGGLADEIILVVPTQLKEIFAEELATHAPDLKVTLVEGGKERSDSVRNALMALSSDSKVVAIHDAARPLASAQLFTKLLDQVQKVDGVIPAKRVVDTIKMVEKGSNRIVKTPPRELLWAVETPQVFNTKLLKQGYEKLTEFATDDAQVVELAGGIVEILESDEPNFKLTFSSDLTNMAQFLS